MSRDFVHLHTHSHYSLLEALPKVDELVKRAKADGQSAIALTDNGNMYAAIEFYKACTKAGIKPLIGVDFFVAPRTRHDKEHGTDDVASRVVLLAKNLEGYKNLIQLVSRSYLEGFHLRPRIDRELIEEHGKGLLAILPSYGGDHAYALRHGDRARAAENLAWNKKIFGADCYAEITKHPEISGHDAEMRGIIDLAREAGVPIVAAQDIYYLDRDDALACDLVNKIRTGGVLNREGEEYVMKDFSFRSSDEMQKLFADIPEAIDNVQTIADTCTVELDLGNWVFPNFPIPAGSSYDDELRKKAYDGIAKRGIELTPTTKERIEYELSVIAKKGYSVYFLVVSDLLTYAAGDGILTNTRGSAAGSLVSYLAGITTVSPLEYQLPFERFLNPERPSPPDIDMDIADNRRDDLIAYARRKYGQDHVAQIGTFGTMMARAAVRDVARALGHPYALGDQIAKLIPFGKQGFPVTIAGAMSEVPDLAELYKRDGDAREILDLAQKIEGNARHVGVHAAGVVISPTEATDFVPLQHDPKGGKIITQYEMHAVEDAGLLKYDFLGLTNLSVLADAIERVRARLGTTVDVNALPLNDAKTYQMLSRGETLGVFQFASSGMTSYLMELEPSNIDDLNAMVALYRPGPMAFIPEYIERKRDPRKVKYLDPRMETILSRSYGIITYQDDVLMIAINLSGYTWLEADKFRKAIGKKIPEEMAAQKERFTTGCIERGMKPETVQKIWDQIETFAAYGFNKAHAASYGNLAYKTAYMKANFPVDYMAAVLTADAGDVERIAEVVAECKRMGIKILPPSVNESMGTFTVVGGAGSVSGGLSQRVGARRSAAAAAADTTPGDTSRGEIRFGLYSIKNFGTGIADAIIAERQKNGRYADISDFITRVTDKNLNKKSIEALIMSGAMDELGERGVLLANIETLLAFHRELEKRPADQGSLFGSSAPQAVAIRLADAPPADLDTKLVWEKELLGLYISGHPLEKHASKLGNVKNTIKHAKEHLKGVETVIGGFIETTQSILTKNGERMAFLKLSDLSDAIEVVAFPRVLKEYEKLLAPGSCILVKGKISERNGTPSFVVEKARAL